MFQTVSHDLITTCPITMCRTIRTQFYLGHASALQIFSTVRLESFYFMGVAGFSEVERELSGKPARKV
jgi:hypothetical protein